MAAHFQFVPSTDLDLTFSMADIYLIKDLIIAKGINVIVGSSDAGKSVLMKNIARKLAGGEELLGIPVPAKRTLLIDLESPEPVWKMQLKAIGVHKDMLFLRDRETWLDLGAKTTPGSSNGHVSGLQAREELVSIINDQGIEVIMLDPLALAWRLESEDDNSEAEQQFGALKNIIHKTGVTFIVSTNMGWSATRGRGASSRKDRADIEIFFSKDGSRRKLEVNKDKFKADRPTFMLEDDKVVMGYILTSRSDEISIAPSRGSECITAILLSIKNGIGNKKDLKQHIVTNLGFNTKMYEREMKELILQGDVLEDSKGDLDLK